MFCLSRRYQQEIPEAFKLFCLSMGFTGELSCEERAFVLGPF